MAQTPFSRLSLAVACLVSCLGQTLLGQTFEVATIKPSDPKVTRGVVIMPHNDSVVATKGTSLKDLIQFAYGGLPPDLVVGGPGWCEQARFDIVAKPEGDGIPAREQYRMMMQALLADRFQLAVHREERQTAVFLLETVKGNGKMKEHQAGEINPRGIFPERTASATRVMCRDVSVADLANYLQTSVLRRPVLDKTNIAGTFDFALTWRREDRPDSDQPDLFTAVRDQLGLKLEAGKSAVEFVVIDRAEKPSAN